MASDSDQQTLVTSDEFDVIFGSPNIETITTEGVVSTTANTIATDVGVIFSSAANTVDMNKEEMKIFEKKNLLNNYTDEFFGFNQIENADVFKKWVSVYNENIAWRNVAASGFGEYFQEYQNRLTNGIFADAGVRDFHIALRNDSSVSTIPSIKESNLNRIIKNLKIVYQIKNEHELSEFLFQKSRLVPSLDLDFEMVLNCIDNFLFEKNLNSEKEIELYTDYEFENIKSISFLLKIKEINMEQSLSFTDELIKKIAEYNDKILSLIQIEILPLQ